MYEANPKLSEIITLLYKVAISWKSLTVIAD